MDSISALRVYLFTFLAGDGPSSLVSREWYLRTAASSIDAIATSYYFNTTGLCSRYLTSRTDKIKPHFLRFWSHPMLEAFCTIRCRLSVSARRNCSSSSSLLIRSTGAIPSICTELMSFLASFHLFFTPLQCKGSSFRSAVSALTVENATCAPREIVSNGNSGDVELCPETLLEIEMFEVFGWVSRRTMPLFRARSCRPVRGLIEVEYLSVVVKLVTLTFEVWSRTDQEKKFTELTESCGRRFLTCFVDLKLLTRTSCCRRQRPFPPLQQPRLELIYCIAKSMY